MSDQQTQASPSWLSPPRYLFVAMVVFVSTRAVALVGASFALARAGTSSGLVEALVLSWDGEWYQDIAADGYDSKATLSPSLRVACPDASVAGCLPGAPDRHSNLAFFPLFPAVIRGLATIGVDPGVAALLIAATTAVVAAVLIAAIARDFAGPRFGLIVVALWGCWPANVVLSSGRPEPLYAALAAAALLLAMRGWLVWAATLTALTGLARFQATAVIVPVVLTAWQSGIRSRDWRPPAAVTVLATSGIVVALGFLGLRAGSLDGWFEVQREWDSTSDWGLAKARYVLDNLGSGAAVHQVAAWTLLIACLLFAAGVAVRIPWQLSVYAGILLAGVLVQSSYHQHSMRFLLVAFPLVFPVAWAIRRWPWRIVVPALGALAVLSAAFQIQLWAGVPQLWCRLVAWNDWWTCGNACLAGDTACH